MTELHPPRLKGAFQLEDGRHLGYAEYGAGNGLPVLWFHGTPGAREQIAPQMRNKVAEHGIRLIAVERPGVGASTPYRYDAFSDWASDIKNLAEAFELEHFGVIGLSGGGPYALACAHAMPDRVVVAVVLGGVAPTVGPDAVSGGVVALSRWFGPVFARSLGPLGRGMQRLVHALEPKADKATDLFLRLMPPGDQRVFADLATRRMFKEDIVEGSRGGMQAMFLDIVLMGRKWGFELRDVTVPVRLWFGDADNIVPLEHGEHLAERLPDAVLKVRPEEGHLGGLGASKEIIDTILGLWPGK